MKPDGGAEESAAVARVRGLLNRRLRVKVCDGRVFYGNLNCFDKQGNVILINATECRPGPGGGGEHGHSLGTAGEPVAEDERHVGSVLILPQHRVETHALEEEDGGVYASDMADAAGGLVNLSLVDHPPPGVTRII